MSINHVLVPELDADFKSLKVNGVTVLPADDGRFTPVITVDDGSVINSQVGVYSVIGTSTQSVIDISIKGKIVVATSTTAYLLSITLPDNWLCFGNTDIVSTGNLFTKGATADGYLVEDAICVTGASTIEVKYNIDGSTAIPVGVGTNFLNFVVKCLVKK